MIQKEILNQMSENEHRQFIFNLNLLLISVRIYFKYGFDEVLDDIEVFGRPVLNELNQIIK